MRLGLPTIDTGLLPAFDIGERIERHRFGS
jgi:hypothetical protein